MAVGSPPETSLAGPRPKTGLECAVQRRFHGGSAAVTDDDPLQLRDLVILRAQIRALFSLDAMAPFFPGCDDAEPEGAADYRREGR